nr:hypothetical protein [Tanacetum cinerariifolium]GFA19930.1 hypothetical protein [Tanacetum cinerariifolium]
TSGAYDHEAGSSRTKRSRHVETVEEALLLNVHHEFLEWSGCSREAKSCYNSRLATLLPKLIYSPHIVDWQLLNKVGYGEEIDQMLKISLKEAESNEDIFFSVAWLRAFNIQEPIYVELCRDWYFIMLRNWMKKVLILIFRVGRNGYEKIQKNDLWLLSMFEARHQNGDLDRTTLTELIDSEERLIPDISVDDVLRGATQKALRVHRASM